MGVVGDVTSSSSALSRTIAALRRWWAVALIGIVVTGAATVAVYHHRGVYYSQSVILLSEPNDANGNPLVSRPSGLVMIASIVQRAIAGPDHIRTVSNDVRLVDTGVRKGWSITLWNGGSQWSNNFDRPQLTVEVAGPDQAEVKTQKAALENRIYGELDKLQLAAAVPDNRWITAHVLSSDTEPYLAGGQPSRAAGMCLVIGIVSTVSLTNWLEGRRRHRRRSHRRPAMAVNDETVTADNRALV